MLKKHKKNIINKVKEYPSAQMMAEFKKTYDDSEWKILTNNRAFLNVFCDDLVVAKSIALKLLGK